MCPGVRAASRALAALGLSAALAPSAAAQVSGSLTRTGSGARAAGMGNAFIAVADDGTAASWNPAGLAQLRRPELSLVMTELAAHTVAEGYRTPDGLFTWTRRSDSASFVTPEFASLAVPVDLGRPTTFQVGWRRLYLIDNRFDVETRREPTGLAPPGTAPLSVGQFDEADGAVDVISLGAAMRVTSRMSLGVSWDLWRGGWSFRESRRQSLGSEPSRLSEQRQRNDLRGDNVNVGLMLHYPSWRLGLVFHAPVSGSLAQSGRVFGLFDEGDLVLDPVESEMEFPASLGFGASWRPRPQWTLAADVTWDAWRDATLVTPGEGRANFFDGRAPAETSTRNTLTFNAGTEWILRRSGHFVPLRVGFSYEPQGTRDPVLFTGFAIKLFSVGAGYNTNRFKFDAAVQYGWLEQASIDTLQLETLRQRLVDPYAFDAVGIRRGRTWRIKLSAILRITDTAALKRTLGRIFGAGGSEDEGGAAERSSRRLCAPRHNALDAPAPQCSP